MRADSHGVTIRRSWPFPRGESVHSHGVTACLFALVALGGCTPYIGLAVHTEYQDAPEHHAPNPLGVFGAEYRTGNLTAYCEHLSSIPHKERGAGLNTCGAKFAITAP